MPLYGMERRVVIARDLTTITHGAGGRIVTDISLPGVVKTRHVERLLGISSSANDYFQASLEITADGNLQVISNAGAALVLKVSWEIVEAEGLVIRKSVPLTMSNAAEVLVNTVVSGVTNLLLTKTQNNGLSIDSGGAAGYHPTIAFQLTATNNLLAVIGRSNSVAAATGKCVLDAV